MTFKTPTFAQIQVGDTLPELQLPPVDRTTLALFAGASGDHNPMHIDIDVARRAGMPDVFAQGMLGMAWLGRVVTAWAPQSQLRTFNARFQGITHLGNAMRCSGRIVEKLEHVLFIIHHIPPFRIPGAHIPQTGQISV